MADRLNVGIVGCGMVARAVHLPLLLKRGDVRVTALVDADARALAAAGERAPGARLWTSLDELLDDDDARPDAVVVALPTAAHGRAARTVMAAGCDLYLEKPLATDPADAAATIDAWRASGRIAMLGFNMRFNPLLRRLRALVMSGRAGDPVHVSTVFATAPRALPEWKRRRATGGGVLLDLGAHHIDFVRFLFGREPVDARCTLSSRASEDDTASLDITLDGGPTVHGFFSLAAAEHDHVELFGDRARLSVSRFTSLDVTITDNPGGVPGAARHLLRRAMAAGRLAEAVRVRSAPLREPGYAIALDRFVDGVRSRRLHDDAADLTDGLACLAVIDAAERSARSARTEPVRWDRNA